MVELLDPLADAFMSVGVFVLVFGAILAWARQRFGGRVERALVQHPRYGPIAAVLLTFPPGCLGVLLVIRVYVRGGVSYGTAIAAFLSTMGDSAWVLFAYDPVLTLQLKALLAAIGVMVGSIVDAVGFEPRRRPVEWGQSGRAAAPATRRRVCTAGSDHSAERTLCSAVSADAEASTPGTARLPFIPGQPAQAQDSLPRRIAVLHSVGVLPVLLWALTALGLVVSLPVTLNAVDADALAGALEGWDPYLILGTAGFLTALAVFLRSGCRIGCPESEVSDRSQPSDLVRQVAKEASFITVWVGIAYLAWELLATIESFGHLFPVVGVGGIVVGALAGLIPACGVELMFAGLFVAGGIPLPTLAAYLVSEDGSGFIPLAAQEPRSAVASTVITTAPALLVGLLFLMFS